MQLIVRLSASSIATAAIITTSERLSHSAEHAVTATTALSTGTGRTLGGRIGHRPCILPREVGSRSAAFRFRRGKLSWKRVFAGNVRTMVLRAVSIVERHLAGFSWTIGVGLILGHDPLSTVRTGIVFAEPGSDAVGVKPVAAWEDRDGRAERGLVHAYATFGFAAFTEIFIRDLFGGERGNGLFGSGTRCVAGLVLFHQLRDDAVKRFLAVDSIAMDGTWAHPKQLKDVTERHGARFSTRHHEDRRAAKATTCAEAALMRRHSADIREHLRDELFDGGGMLLKRLWAVRIAGIETGIGRGGKGERIAWSMGVSYEGSSTSSLWLFLLWANTTTHSAVYCSSQQTHQPAQCSRLCLSLLLLLLLVLSNSSHSDISREVALEAAGVWRLPRSILPPFELINITFFRIWRGPLRMTVNTRARSV